MAARQQLRHPIIHSSRALLVLCLSVFSVYAAHAQQAMDMPCSSKATLTEIAPNTWVRRGNHGLLFETQEMANLGVIAGDRCVAIIDTGGSPTEGHDLSCAVTQVTSVPICYVINTHAHPDHFFGNAAFEKPGVEIIAHSRFSVAFSYAAQTWLDRAGVGLDALALPGSSVTDTRQLDLGNRLLTLQAHPAAHTDSDISVYDKKTGTLWAGDLLFMELLPAVTASLSGWLDVMDALAATDIIQVVPGHGPVTARWPQALMLQLDYLKTLQTETRQAIDDDLTLEQALQMIATRNRWGWLFYDELHKRNVSRAYAEIEWE